MMAELWKKFMYLFEDDVDDHGVFSVEFIIYSLLRFCSACLIIPLWLILGAVTFGLLWPPQVRETLLTSRLTMRSEKAEEDRDRMQRVSSLRQDVSNFHDEVVNDIDKGRDEIDTIKVLLDGARTEISMEMDSVKEIVTELFERLSST